MLLALLAGALRLQAQDSTDTIESMRRATELVQQNKLIEARPYLLVLIKEGSEKNRSKMVFYIALSYVYESFNGGDEASLNEAKARFEQYISDYPDDELVPLAQYNLADIYAAKREYDAALKILISLYDSPPTGVDRLDILRKINRVYVAKKDWVAAMPYFRDTIKFSHDETERTTAAAYLLIGQAKQGEISNARELLEFFKTPAPVFYTLRFNAAMMEIGDQLHEEGELAYAGLFYQLVRSYETLEEGLTNSIAVLEAQSERLKGSIEQRDKFIENQAMLETARAELEALHNSTNYSPLLSWRIARLYLEVGRDWEAYWRFRVLADKYPDHPQSEDILYAAFSLAEKLDQYDSAVKLARQYFQNKRYRKYRGQIVSGLGDIYREQGEWDLFFKLTTTYLAESEIDRIAVQLVFKHGVARLERLENQKLIDDFDAISQQYGQSALADELHYFLGLASLLEQDYNRAIAEFDAVIADPESLFRKDASFRKALAVMGQENFEEARTLIREFIKNYPNNALRAEAEIALGDIENTFANQDVAIIHYNEACEHTTNVTLLGKAKEKIANILWQQGKQEQAIDELEQFTAQYTDSPEVIASVVTLAGFYTEMGSPRDALACIRTTVQRFIEEPRIDAMGSLLAQYLMLDTEARTMSKTTESFVDEMQSNPERLQALINNRAEQYRFFKENPMIDPSVKENFVRNKAFRAAVLQSPEPLEKLANELHAMDAKMMSQPSAVEEIRARLDAALEHEDIPLAVRFEAALAQQETPVRPPSSARTALVVDDDIWAQLDPRAKLWILQEIARDDPQQCVAPLEEMLPEYANTEAELDIHLLLADIYEQLGMKEKALERYHSVVQRFSSKDVAGDCALKEAQLLGEMGRYDESRKVLESVLARAGWRGERHAQALLQLGDIYTGQKEYAEAHGFYERIILGYPSFSDALAMAFYRDIRVLEKMHEADSARTVYEAFLQTPGLEDTQGAQLIRSEIQL